MSALASKAERLAIASTVAAPVRQNAARRRPVALIGKDGRSKGTSDTTEVTKGVLARAGIEFSVQPGETAIRAALRGGRSAGDACFGGIVTCEPGDKFGLLTVLSRGSSKGGRYRVCECAGCGTVKDVAADKLKSGESKTCGRKGCRGKGAIE